MASNQNQRTQETMHSLRQPLNALRLTLANLLHRMGAEGKQLDLVQAKGKLELMDLQIQRMADIIDGMQVAEENTDR